MSTPPSESTISRRTAMAGLGAGGLGMALTFPAWVARAQDATPVAPRVPRFGHPLIGTWQITNDPDSDPNPYLTYATFTDDGTYVETGTRRYVGIGTWRATGEQTAEFAYLVLEPAPLDEIYAPDYVVSLDLWTPGGPPLFRGTIEVDATGDVMDMTGTYEFQDGNGGVTSTYPYIGRGDRMDVFAGTAATPTP